MLVILKEKVHSSRITYCFLCQLANFRCGITMGNIPKFMWIYIIYDILASIRLVEILKPNLEEIRNTTEQCKTIQPLNSRK